MGMGEKEFITAVVQKGYVSEDQARACMVMRDEMAVSGGGETTIWDFMIFNGLLTPDQVREVQEMEAAEAKAAAFAPPPPSTEAPKPVESKTTLPTANSTAPASTGSTAVKSKERVPFGPFLIEGKLGEGAMGVVYLASNKETGHKVALKVLPQRFTDNQEYIQRFVREAKIAVTLKHSNIANGVAYGEFNRRWYYAMEYVEGKVLKRVIQENVALEEKRAAGIAAQIADALEFIRSRGLVHRDVKPGNIIVSPQGVAKLMDLGLAKSTRGEFDQLTVGVKTMGTPHYMAPEQIRGEKTLDIRADIYSLGATLYEMLTGQQPFKGTTITETLQKQLRNELDHPRDYVADLSDGICRIIQKSMAKQAKDRYQTPAEMKDDLYAVLKGESPKAKLLEAGLSMVARRPVADASTRSQPIGDSVKPLEPLQRVSSPAAVPPRRAARLVLGLAVGFGIVAIGFALAYFAGWLPAAPVVESGGRHASRLEAAEGHLAAREWTRALSAAQEVLAEEPHHPRAESIKVRAEAGLKYDDAINRARTYVSSGDWRRAFSAYEEALKVRPNDSEASAGLIAVGEKLSGDPAAWIEKRTLTGHAGTVLALAFDPTGARLASADDQNLLRVWEFDSGQVARDFAGLLKPVRCAAFSPDGRQLATGGEDMIVRVWDLSSGMDLVRFAAHGQPVLSVQFRPDGSQVVTSGEDGTVGFWEVKGGASRGSLRGHTRGVTGVAMFDEARAVVTAGRDGTVRLWDNATGREKRSLAGGGASFLGLAAPPEGAWIAAAAQDGSIRVWDTRSWRLIQTLTGHQGEITCLAASRDGSWLASGSRDGTVRLWDPAAGKELKVLRGHTGEVRAVAFHPSSATVVSAGSEGMLRVWGARK